MDLALLYGDTQTRVIDLVSTLPASALTTLVPGTPQWTVEQLIAHVTGIAADMVDGRTEGAATAPWTSRQVAERAGRPFADVLAEWRRRSPGLLAMLATPGQVDAAAFDLLTHEHDLRGTFHLARASDPEAVFAVTTRVTGRVGHMVDKAGLPGLRLVHDTGEWVCGTAPVGVTGTATTFEWFRALFGRRSAAQILTYYWHGDPSPYFDLLNLFGPLPSADVAEAGAPVPDL
jgi:uncharacterized protein (TIGR03083 family)